MNPFFGGGMNVAQMLQQFKANPMQMLMQRRLNVPQGMMNDPGAIMNHLLQTGQISQSQVDRAYQMARNFRG
ncbi:MAG: hypothetical protein IJT62_04360 [Oscillospiraceae bacterium]|nr:hypothetical protein [Oscillospiraceae bacterium]